MSPPLQPDHGLCVRTTLAGTAVIPALIAAPAVGNAWPTRAPDAWNTHAEPRDPIPLRVIAPDQRVFGTRHFPGLFNRTKAAAEFGNCDSPAILHLVQMVSQAGPKTPGLTHIHM